MTSQAQGNGFDFEDLFKIENLTCDNFEYVSKITNEEIEVIIFYFKLLLHENLV